MCRERIKAHRRTYTKEKKKWHNIELYQASKLKIAPKINIVPIFNLWILRTRLFFCVSIKRCCVCGCSVCVHQFYNDMLKDFFFNKKGLSDNHFNVLIIIDFDSSIFKTQALKPSLWRGTSIVFCSCKQQHQDFFLFCFFFFAFSMVSWFFTLAQSPPVFLIALSRQRTFPFLCVFPSP